MGVVPRLITLVWLLSVSAHARAHGQSATAWSIDPEPSVIIGASLNDANDQLGRVVDVTRLDDGSIAVLDGILLTVRLYAPDGRHVRDIGRRGDGPGEFNEPTAIRQVGDELVVLDKSGRRTWFGLDGEVVRTDRAEIERLCPENYNPAQGGLLPDGRVLVRCQERLFGRVRGEYRAEVILLREPASSEPRSGEPASSDPVRLGRFPSDTIRTDTEGVAVPRPYLPRRTLLTAAAGERVFVVAPDRPEVRVVAGTAGPATSFSIEVDARDRAVTDRDIEESTGSALRYVVRPNDRRVVGEWLDGMPRSERTPVLRSLIAAGSSEAWVETWKAADDGAKWIVADVSGAAGGELARVRVPRGLDLRVVGSDYVLGVWRDEFGVEQLRVHALRRS